MRRAALFIAFLTAGAALGQDVAPGGGAVGPNGATTQTQGSADGNIPTATTDGVAVRSQCKVAVFFSAPSGQTITACTAKLWASDYSTGRWAEQYRSDNACATGRRDIAVGTFTVAPYGRFYVEAESVTTSGGGAVTVRLLTYHCKAVN